MAEMKIKHCNDYAKGIRWENGDDMFDWWMEDNHSKPTDECQLSLFSDGTFDDEEE